MKKENYKLHLEAFHISKARKTDKSEIMTLKSSIEMVQKERNILRNKVKDLEINIENLNHTHQSCVTDLQIEIDTYNMKDRCNEKEIYNLRELLGAEIEKTKYHT